VSVVGARAKSRRESRGEWMGRVGRGGGEGLRKCIRTVCNNGRCEILRNEATCPRLHRELRRRFRHCTNAIQRPSRRGWKAPTRRSDALAQRGTTPPATNHHAGQTQMFFFFFFCRVSAFVAMCAALCTSASADVLFASSAVCGAGWRSTLTKTPKSPQAPLARVYCPGEGEQGAGPRAKVHMGRPRRLGLAILS
jgi:hypothetical protein